MAERIEAERKRIDAEWIDAFREETGYQLMTLLRQEPRLLTIKYCGCSVLHLAMRHNWFSLVLEILLQFKHLYKDASFLYRRILSPSDIQNLLIFVPNTEDFQSSSTVDSQATTGDLASFRDLLEAKEDGGETSSRGKGAKWKYESGLDVFAMAVIQGDAAINTLLAEAVLQVDGLFDHPHPYKDVVRFFEEREETGESNSSPDRHKEERKLLCELIEACFPVPDGIDVKLDHVLETVSKQPHEQQRATDSQATPATSGPKQLEHWLADKIDPEWMQEWELTSRFLPLEEFLFLACFSIRNRTLEGKKLGIQNRMLQVYRIWGRGASFTEYLLGIKDTRGSALHHMVRRGGSTLHHTVRRGGGDDWFEEMVTRDVDTLENFINVRDSVRRTPLYIVLALGDMIKTKLLFKIKTTIIDNLKHTLWMRGRLDGGTLKECVRWQFKGRVWLADVAIVSIVNLAPQEDEEIYSALLMEGQVDEEIFSALLMAGRVGVNTVDMAWLGVKRGSDNSHNLIIYKLATNAPHVIIQSQHLSDEDRSRLTRIYAMGKYRSEPGFGKITWLQLAAHLGDPDALQRLANDDEVYDPSRLNNSSLPSWSWGSKYGTVLHAAAAGGHPHAIRTILATGKFDPLVQDDEGNTALHLATHFPAPLQVPYSLTDFCEIPKRRIGTSYQGESSLSTEGRKDLVRIKESRRQGCINLLLQAGIDVWQTNRVREMADPGPKASAEYSTWWYDKVSKETQEARTSLNAAANAISVTAALVATASYVGPLQPPLGYDAQSEGLQVDVLSVRIFIVCNTLAFYLALAAIMLSLTPSLSMPQVSILDELKLIRRTVTLAVGLLLLSMIAILVAFASASIAVIPDEGSWNHIGLSVGTLGVGGSICLLVLVLCIFRLLRLAFHKRKYVRRFYNKYVCM